ncbi:MAG: hypothetical protein ACE5NG_01065 [bacterium]
MTVPRKTSLRILQESVFALLFFLLPSFLSSQTNNRTNSSISLYEGETTFITDSLKLHYPLPDSLLIPDSESVWADSTQLQRREDYSIDYLAGIIQLKKHLPSGVPIRIEYQKFPFTLKRSYFRRELLVSTEEEQNNSTQARVKKPSAQPRPQQMFASQLRKNGSITRGISVGTNQGLRVDSGLRIQISGRLTDKVDVVASLTDQNTPIQPEGNTQTLQEIDKVFVQINGPNLRATLGDYNLNFAGTEFTRYSRKLQGFMGRAEFQNWEVTLSGAVSHGRFNTNEFLGQEGNQGPYQLRGTEGQINIIVLAGTERVWVDGELMTRGENHDYIIEYGNGQITFTRNRLITADSRITVDFQFSDESFQRNLWGIRGESRMFGEKVKFGTTFIRESDDKDDPLSINLNDRFVESLEAAGDSVAVVPGDTLVGQGKGNYIKDSTGVFVYVGPDSGNYNVSFSFFGQNKGDYRNIGLGRFEYVGENQGSYRPFIVLPKAQRHDLVGFNFDLTPLSSFNLKSELAFSQFDANLYSPKDDDDNQGTAYTIKLNFQPEKLSLWDVNLGRLDFRAKLRRKSTNFRDIDRTTIAEFNRRWNISGLFSTAEETIGELRAAYIPIQGISLRGGLGKLSKSSSFQSNRWEAEATINKKNLPKINYFVEFIDRDDQNIKQQSSWLRQRAHAYFDLKKLKPTFDYEGEIKKDAQNDTSLTGFRFDSYTAGLEVTPWKSMSAYFRYNYRDDRNREKGMFLPRSVAKTHSFAWSLKNWKSISANATYTHRQRDFTDNSIQDTRTDLADFRIGYTPRNSGVRCNFYYQISNTQVAQQQEIFLEVEKGQGNFRFNEKLNEFEPDPFGNYVRRIFTTNEFVPVIELRARADLRLMPRRFFKSSQEKSKPKSLVERLLSPVSTETFVRIDERTRERDVAKIYLLNLSYFQQDTTTIFGSIEFRQDLHLWENSRKLSLRYRYRNRSEKNNQFIDGGQDRKVREQSLRLIHQFSKQISSQIEFSHFEEDRLFKSLSREDRKVRSNKFAIDLVYRPERRLEFGLKSLIGLNKDIIQSPETKANLISFKPRSNYSLSRQGRFRGEIEWTKVFVSPRTQVIPFELTDGNRAGTTLRWNFGFDYRLSRNVQASLSYFGRREPDRPKTQHIAKMEMRAFF